MTSHLWYDSETFSETPLSAGVHRYAETVEIMVITWALDDGPVKTWDVTDGSEMPYELFEALTDDDILVVAHNSGFDRTVLRHVMPNLCPPINRWRDSMVKAMAHGLPGGLAKIGEILGLAEEDAKQDGKELIHLFCKPRPKNSKLRRATRHTHPEEWARFLVYAGRDIGAMRIAYRKLPEWNYKGKELDLWHLDQRINDAGVCIDLDLCSTAITAAEKAKAELAARTIDLTLGEVESTTKRDKLLKHLLEYHGVTLPDMQASTLERRINDPELPWAVRELLDIRLQASMGSTSKYKAALKSVSKDGFVRGLLQFDGASRTRRWAGRIVQPQNMFRPPKHIKRQWEEVITAIKAGAIDLVLPNVMEATAATARGMIVPPAGMKIVTADLSNIEGRDAAWLAGEAWKLKAFRDYDTILGHTPDGKVIRQGADLYVLAYAKSFGVSPEGVDDDQRQVGKVQELALGYEGGVGAFLTFSLLYGIDLEAMAEEAWNSIPGDALENASGFYDWTVKKHRSTFGLSRRAFVTCDAFKRLWREAHPNLHALWGDMKNTAVEAVNNPGQQLQCRKFKMRRDGNWLRIGLPSGRALCYPAPQVNDGELSYMGVNQYTRKWARIKTYGGKLFENACQSLARDVMADNMQHIEDAGYRLALTVHDEVITYAPLSDEFNAPHLASILSRNHDWCMDLPLAAAGFEGLRYRKD